MKKYLLILASIVTIGGGLLLGAPMAQAESEFATTNSDQVTLVKDKTINGAYYATGSDITINGTVKGDLYCGGQTVQINGTVEGDVICAAQTIKINGTVKQDVRSAAQVLTVSGQVGGTITSFAQTVDIVKGATVGGDLNGAGQVITIDGTVKRDVVIGGEKLTIAGLVEGSVHADITNLTLTSQPAILGNLEYNSANEQSIAKSAVLGTVKFDENTSADSKNKNSANRPLIAPIFIAATLVVTSAIIALIMPRYLERSHYLARQKFGLVILAGIAINLGTPFLGIALALTGVGIPLAIALFAFVLALNVLAFPFVAFFLARTFFDKLISNIILLIVAGALILALLLSIPLLGLLIFMLTTTIGVGSLAITMTNGYQRPSYQIENAAPAKVVTSRKK